MDFPHDVIHLYPGLWSEYLTYVFLLFFKSKEDTFHEALKVQIIPSD